MAGITAIVFSVIFKTNLNDNRLGEETAHGLDGVIDKSNQREYGKTIIKILMKILHLRTLKTKKQMFLKKLRRLLLKIVKVKKNKNYYVLILLQSKLELC